MQKNLSGYRKNRKTWDHGRLQILIFEKLLMIKKVSYVGRIHRSSPSEGDGESHKIEQTRILDEALKK